MTANPPTQTLFELEVRAVDATVVQRHNQLPACASPGCLGLPDVSVLVAYWIVTETATARRHRLYQIRCWIAGVAHDWTR